MSDIWRTANIEPWRLRTSQIGACFVRSGGCRVLYHFAADYRLWIPRPDETYRINIDDVAEGHLLARDRGSAGERHIVYALHDLGRHAESAEYLKAARVTYLPEALGFVLNQT